ncbi:MAG: tetratricopeptide repeat protein [Candidatus Wallbacteria bacterium]|nr:tetratricopeptide repeat protein [Candidatus Wallbacteria bacterium]
MGKKRPAGRRQSFDGDPIEWIEDFVERVRERVFGLRVHEWVMLAVALVPLVFVPQILDLYDMPKRIALNLLVFLLVIFHSFASLRDDGGILLPRGRIVWPVLAYFVAMGLACVKVINGADALDSLLQQGLPALLALILLVRGISEGAAESFVSCCILTCTMAVVLGLAQFAGVETETWGLRQVIKPASCFGNKNMAAEYVLSAYPYLLYRWELAGFGGIHTFTVAMVLSFIFVSQTKATWFGSFILLALFGWRVLSSPPARARFGRNAPMLAGGAFVFLLLINLPALMAGKSDSAGVAAVEHAVSSTEGSAKVRFALWANTVPMLRDVGPLLGTGPGNWYLHYPKYAFAVLHDPTFSTAAQAEHPHNDSIQILGEAGLLGVLATVWIVLTLGRVFFANPLALSEDVSPAAQRNFYVGLSLLGILIDGVFAYPLHLAPGAGYFWVGTAILVAFTPGFEVKPWRLPGAAITVIVVSLLSAFAAMRDLRLMAANYYYRLGAISMAGSNWKEADQHISASLGYDATRYRTHSVLGRCLAMEGRIKDSIAQYQAALACHPNQINVLYNLAHSLKGDNQVDEAIKILKRSIQVVPNFQEGLYLLGSFEKETGKRDDAIATFKRLTEVAPTYADAFNELGNLYKDQKKYPLAETAYRKALEAKPAYGEVFNNLGVVFLEQNKLAPSAENFKKAIALSPGYPGSYYNLARAETGLGHAAQAIEAYRQFVNRWTGDDGMSNGAKAEIARLERLLAAPPVVVKPVAPAPTPAKSITPAKTK